MSAKGDRFSPLDGQGVALPPQNVIYATGISTSTFSLYCVKTFTGLTMDGCRKPVKHKALPPLDNFCKCRKIAQVKMKTFYISTNRFLIVFAVIAYLYDSLMLTKRMSLSTSKVTM